MKGGIRQSLAWLHTWCGLVFGWVLFAIFLTGTLSVFEHEIDTWMQPELRQARAAPREEVVVRAEQVLRREAPPGTTWQLILPDGDGAAVELRWRQGRERVERHVDAATGRVIEPRETLGGHFFVDFHYSLMAGRAGIWAVAAATMAMLATLISGIVIHKRIFKDFFTFRPQAASQRAWLDAHNALAVLALPFHLMITYTGLVISFAIYMPIGLQLFFGGSPEALRAQVVTPFERPAAGRPAELLPLAPYLERAEALLGPDSAQLIVVRNPGDAHAVVEVFRRFDDRIPAVADRVAFDGTTGALIGSQTEWNRAALVWRALVGLHLAQFGGDAMRWLYFLCGLAGSGMVASGLVLFTAKRRRRHAAETTGFDRVVERANVAAVAGVVVACAAYFWLNRLLPVGMPERASWEVGLLLPVWLATAVHAALRRPARRAWAEQLGLAAALCAMLPVLDVATAASDGIRGAGQAAGLNLTALGLGLGLGLGLVTRHLARGGEAVAAQHRAAAAAAADGLAGRRR